MATRPVARPPQPPQVAMYSNFSIADRGRNSNNANASVGRIEALPVYAPPATPPPTITSLQPPHNISTATAATTTTSTTPFSADFYPTDSSTQAQNAPPNSSTLPPPYQAIADPSGFV
ncbi:hypothetical protein HK100_010876, partial [Physocladia obscura]